MEDGDLWKTYGKTDCENRSVDVVSCPNGGIDPNCLDKQNAACEGATTAVSK